MLIMEYLRDAIATSTSIDDSYNIAISSIVIRIIFVVYKEDFVKVIIKFISDIVSAVNRFPVVIFFNNVEVLSASIPAPAATPAPINDSLQLT